MVPIVSVLITNYNYGSYIGEAICSVARQSYPSVELVIADDASMDGSLEEIIYAVRKSREHLGDVSIRAAAENGGKNALLNKEISRLSGEYIILLDADDVLDDEYIEKCMEILLLARHSSDRIGFVYTDCELIDAVGNELCTGRSREFDAQAIRKQSYIPDCALTVRSALIQALPFNENLRSATKHSKWQKIIGSGWRGTYINQPMFRYRMHGSNMSSIGSRVLNEIREGKRDERILSGYWPVSNDAVITK